MTPFRTFKSRFILSREKIKNKFLILKLQDPNCDNQQDLIELDVDLLLKKHKKRSFYHFVYNRGKKLSLFIHKHGKKIIITIKNVIIAAIIIMAPTVNIEYETNKEIELINHPVQEQICQNKPISSQEIETFFPIEENSEVRFCSLFRLAPPLTISRSELEGISRSNKMTIKSAPKVDVEYEEHKLSISADQHSEEKKRQKSSEANESSSFTRVPDALSKSLSNEIGIKLRENTKKSVTEIAESFRRLGLEEILVIGQKLQITKRVEREGQNVNKADQNTIQTIELNNKFGSGSGSANNPDNGGLYTNFKSPDFKIRIPEEPKEFSLMHKQNYLPINIESIILRTKYINDSMDQQNFDSNFLTIMQTLTLFGSLNTIYEQIKINKFDRLKKVKSKNIICTNNINQFSLPMSDQISLKILKKQIEIEKLIEIKSHKSTVKKILSLSGGEVILTSDFIEWHKLNRLCYAWFGFLLQLYLFHLLEFPYVQQGLICLEFYYDLLQRFDSLNQGKQTYIRYDLIMHIFEAWINFKKYLKEQVGIILPNEIAQSILPVLAYFLLVKKFSFYKISKILMINIFGFSIKYSLINNTDTILENILPDKLANKFKKVKEFLKVKKNKTIIKAIRDIVFSEIDRPNAPLTNVYELYNKDEFSDLKNNNNIEARGKKLERKKKSIAEIFSRQEENKLIVEHEMATKMENNYVVDQIYEKMKLKDIKQEVENLRTFENSTIPEFELLKLTDKTQTTSVLDNLQVNQTKARTSATSLFPVAHAFSTSLPQRISRPKISTGLFMQDLTKLPLYSQDQNKNCQSHKCTFLRNERTGYPDSFPISSLFDEVEDGTVLNIRENGLSVQHENYSAEFKELERKTATRRAKPFLQSLIEPLNMYGIDQLNLKSDPIVDPERCSVSQLSKSSNHAWNDWKINTFGWSTEQRVKKYYEIVENIVESATITQVGLLNGQEPVIAYLYDRPDREVELALFEYRPFYKFRHFISAFIPNKDYVSHFLKTGILGEPVILKDTKRNISRGNSTLWKMRSELNSTPGVIFSNEARIGDDKLPESGALWNILQRKAKEDDPTREIDQTDLNSFKDLLKYLPRPKQAKFEVLKRSILRNFTYSQFRHDHGSQIDNLLEILNDKVNGLITLNRGRQTWPYLTYDELMKLEEKVNQLINIEGIPTMEDILNNYPVPIRETRDGKINEIFKENIDEFLIEETDSKF